MKHLLPSATCPPIMAYRIRDAVPSPVAAKCAVPDCTAEARGLHDAWKSETAEFPGNPWRIVKRPLCQHHRRMNTDHTQAVEQFTTRHAAVHPRDHPYWSKPQPGNCTIQCHHDPAVTVMWNILDVYNSILYTEDALPAGLWVGGLARLPVGARLEEAFA